MCWGEKPARGENKGESKGESKGGSRPARGLTSRPSKGGEQDDEPDLEPRHESVQRAQQSRPQQEDSKVKDRQYVGWNVGW